MQKKSSSRGPKRGSFSNEKFNLLGKVIVRYHREAEKCASVRAYYAACIMIGTAFEAMLLQMCDLFEDEVAEAAMKLPRDRKDRSNIGASMT
jgi:aminoglycoside phosphotransferase family enzyme